MSVNVAAAPPMPPPMPPPGGSGGSSSVSVLERPPPDRLVGHENLFGYWLLSKWSKDALRASQGGAGSTLDSLLQSAGLPLLAGDRLADGSPAVVHPNDSLMSMAFQAPAAPLPRHQPLSDAQRRALTFSATGRQAVGPLQLAGKLDALVAQRAAMLDLEGRQARREKKRRKRDREAAAAARVNIDVQSGPGAAAAAAQSSPATGAGAADGSDGRFKLTVSLGGSKKRKADGGATPGDKPKKKKQELVV